MDISSISAAITTVKELMKWNEKIKDTQFQLLLSSLLDSISDLKIEIANLKEENVALREDNLKYKEQLSQKEDIVFDSNRAVCFKQSDVEKKEPLCPVCFDDRGVVNHLFDVGNSEIMCKVCRTIFKY